MECWPISSETIGLLNIISFYISHYQLPFIFTTTAITIYCPIIAIINTILFVTHDIWIYEYSISTHINLMFLVYIKQYFALQYLFMKNIWTTSLDTSIDTFSNIGQPSKLKKGSWQSRHEYQTSPVRLYNHLRQAGN